MTLIQFPLKTPYHNFISDFDNLKVGFVFCGYFVLQNGIILPC
jgi:hypothetical protein